MRLLRLYTLFIYIALAASTAGAQTERPQNRPYTDLRPLHFGIVVGAHMQDMEFNNVGLQTLTYQDGTQKDAEVTVDQSSWSMGFNVGVLMEARLNDHFAFRFAPQLYFGTRQLTFYDFRNKDAQGNAVQEQQDMRAVYVGADADLIYAARRHNNHRPYLMAGLAPMINLTNTSSDYVRMKKFDLFLEVGIGCDFYLPFFKLRPELKFMYGLTNSLDGGFKNQINDESKLPYAASADRARSKMIVLSFYFE